MDAVKFWDDLAVKYAKSPIDDMEAYEYTLKRVRSYLGASDRVLEVGCGTGSTALLLADGVEQIVAGDISPNMVAIAKEKAAAQGIANVRFETAPVDAMDAGPFDAVMGLNVLHLMDDVEADIAAIRARLKPGGIFISKTFFVPKRGESLKSRVMRAVLPIMRAIGKAPKVRIFRDGELDMLIEGAGFEIVETGNYPKDRRFVVARKV